MCVRSLPTKSKRESQRVGVTISEVTKVTRRIATSRRFPILTASDNWQALAGAASANVSLSLSLLLLWLPSMSRFGFKRQQGFDRPGKKTTRQ
jgi:hypothetical protein